MYEFEFITPDSLGAACDALAADDAAQVIAGGMTLLPTMKLRLAMPSSLIDLTGLAELTGITANDDGLVIGAATTHADVAASEVVARFCPALAQLAGGIGDPQVRNRGTMGGSLANSDPAADYPAAVLGLNATVVTNCREIQADEFFLGMFETALAPDEVIRCVRFPRWARAAYAKFPNPASRYAVVGVFVAAANDRVRVAVTGAGASVFRHHEMEAALAGSFGAATVKSVAIDGSEFNEDIHASAEYRANLVSVMAARAVTAAGG